MKPSRSSSQSNAPSLALRSSAGSSESSNFSASSPAAMPSSRCAYSYHRVHARMAVDPAGLAEGHVFAGDVLKFDRNVFEHVPEPGTLAFAHAPHEAAGFAVGT